MKFSSSFVVPSAVAVLSTALPARPGSVANPDWLRRHDSPVTVDAPKQVAKPHVSERGANTTAPRSDCVNRSNVNREHAFVCAGLGDGEACQPGESRQELQRWLCIKLPKRQRSLGRMQRVGRRYGLWTFLANVPRHHHP